MKAYIFLTSPISNMGGAQMYVSNKLRYLQEKGWTPIALSWITKPIIIENLRPFENNNVPELRYSIHTFSKRKLNSILKKIKNIVDEFGFFDEIVIESHIFSLIPWGERIAEYLGAKHIIFILDEIIPKLTTAQFNFFKFKVFRHELMGSVKRYKTIFGNDVEDSILKYAAETPIMPFCSNVIDYSSEKKLFFVNKGFNIISIARLDKPYIIPLINELVKFCQINSSYHFNFVFIGNESTGRVEKQIKSLFSVVKNADLYLLGYLCPIPIHYLDEINAAVAVSNSILVTSNEGIPTIAVDVDDYYAIGIFGSTTTNKLRRTTEPQVEVSSLLSDVLTNKICPTIQKNQFTQDTSTFDAHMNFCSVKEEKEYFDISQLCSLPYKIKVSLIHIKIRILLFFGLLA